MLFVPFCQNAPLCATGCHGAKGLLPNALVGVVAPHVGLLFLVGEAFGGIYAARARADAALPHREAYNNEVLTGVYSR